MTDEEIRAIYDQGPEAVVAMARQLLAQIAGLAARVKRLEDRLATDSHNSSKPPSSDPPGHKPAPKSLRGKSGQKPGGQPGHPGTTLAMSEHPDRVVVHSPARCRQCQADLGTAPVVAVQRRQVIDLPPIKVEVVEHQAEERQCPCGATTKASFPVEVSGHVQYGPNLKAAAVYFNQVQLLPSQRTVEIMREGLGCPSFSEGTLAAAIGECYQQVAPAEMAIKKQIQQATVAHFDETGLNLAGKLHWLHVASTTTLTHYGWHARRGQEGSAALGIAPDFTGIGMHDGLASYWHYAWKHALCNVHHLRELIFGEERLGQSWATELKDLLLEIKRVVADARAQGKSALPPVQTRGFETRYGEILTAGFAANPPPERPLGAKGRPKRGKMLSLLDRLHEHREAVLRFMYDFRVPFDNNLAERDLRMVKVKEKVSGGFREETGASMFCRIRSYASTARKQGQPLLPCIRDAFLGHPFIPAIRAVPAE